MKRALITGITGQDGAYLVSACLFLFNLEDDAYAAACAAPVPQTGRSTLEGQAGSSNGAQKDRNRMSHIYVGSGKDIHIAELAQIVKEIVGYEGDVSWDSSMPDGTPRKSTGYLPLNRAGMEAPHQLRDGIKSIYDWYLAQSELT
jgi:hypothetical protein